jgi:hypothetical protein
MKMQNRKLKIHNITPKNQTINIRMPGKFYQEQIITNITRTKSAIKDKTYNTQTTQHLQLTSSYILQ